MLGENVKKLRLNAGLTPTQLEDKTGVSRAYIVNIENGKKKNPSQEILEKLAIGLNTTIQSLYKDDSNIQSDVSCIDAQTSGMLNRLIDDLVKSKRIKDANNIDKATTNLLLSALKLEIQYKLTENEGSK